MANYRVLIRMSQGGRSNKDAHSVVFTARPQGAYTAASANACAVAVAGVLSALCYESTHFMRVVFSELQANGHVVKNSGDSVPLNTVGLMPWAAGDGPSRDEICLAIEKHANHGKRNGVTYLRHCLSAQEEADYLNSGTIAERFTVLPVGVAGAGGPAGVGLLDAFTANGWDLMLPPVKINGALTQRVVDAVAAQDFRVIKVTKIRKTVERSAAEAAQRQLNEWARNAKDLYDRAVAAGQLALVVVTITEIIAEATAFYGALALAERLLVSMPEFPALPAP